MVIHGMPDYSHVKGHLLAVSVSKHAWCLQQMHYEVSEPFCRPTLPQWLQC